MINSSAERTTDGNVFDRPLHLAGILDNAADDLQRTWFGYEWNDRARCNCGFVARQVMNTSAVRLRQQLPPICENGKFRPTWSAMSEIYCTETGLSRNEVFSRLLATGLRMSDFAHLENLSHEDILPRMGAVRPRAKPVSRSRKTDVVAYLRQWAWGIEEFREQASIRSREKRLSGSSIKK
jgi:hypothetical protein